MRTLNSFKAMLSERFLLYGCILLLVMLELRREITDRVVYALCVSWSRTDPAATSLVLARSINDIEVCAFQNWIRA